MTLTENEIQAEMARSACKRAADPAVRAGARAETELREGWRENLEKCVE